MIIYISSPYTIGDVAENVHVQIAASHRIMDMGHSPAWPLSSHFLHMFRQRSYEDWLRVDLELVPTAHVLLRLPGKSAGADREILEAHEHNVPVVYGWKELEAFLGNASSILNHPMARLAHATARAAHAGQFRKNGVTPYIEHPEAVAKAVASHGVEAVAVAYLHDVLEDTRVTLDDLVIIGLPASVIAAVTVLTKREGVSYDRYLAFIRVVPLARMVKIADISHNLSCDPSPEKRDIYEKALVFLQS